MSGNRDKRARRQTSARMLNNPGSSAGRSGRGTEPPKDGFARDRRTVWSWRASRQRLVNPLGSTDDPAAYRKQQRHPGDRQCRRPMVRSLMNGSPKT